MAWLKKLLFIFTLPFHLVSCTFVAFAPKEFHPGWTYSVHVMVIDVPSLGHRTTVFGTIMNGQRKTMGAGTVTLDNGVPGLMKIEVAPNIMTSPGDTYTLQLDAMGGLSFSSFSPIQQSTLSHLTFVQTDRAVYAPGQVVRFRTVSVNQDMFPQKVAKNITFQNPRGVVVAWFFDAGTNSVYENTMSLAAFPGLGQWKIIVSSTQANLMEQYVFAVDEFETPKFTVDAAVSSQILVKENDVKKVTVSVAAKCTCGRGVTGDLRFTILLTSRTFNRIISSSITDASGRKDFELDLAEAVSLASDNGDTITIVAEVTDSQGLGTYSGNVTVKVVKQPVKMWFSRTKTDFVYRTGMPFQAVVEMTDPVGEALDSARVVNPLVLSLTDTVVPSSSMENQVQLTPGQKAVVWNLPALNSSGSLILKAMLVYYGRKYEIMATVQRYQALNDSISLNARWISYFPLTNSDLHAFTPQPLNIGNTISFIVDVSRNISFSSITYAIVSRSNIQAMGTVVGGQRVDITVTTAMCPKGRIIVVGITSVPPGSSQKREVLTDSLGLSVQQCRGKKVMPSLQQTSGSEVATPGSYVTLNIDIAWADPGLQNSVAVGSHDVFLLAIDKDLLTLQGGQQDITPDRIENGLNKLNISSSASGSDATEVLEASGRRRREVSWKDPYTDVVTAVSTGELLRSTGLVILTDMNYMRAVDSTFNSTLSTAVSAQTASRSVQRSYADTWIWKTGRTNDVGRLSIVERLPDTVNTWVVSAFAVKDGSEFAITSDLLELKATKSLRLVLKMPGTICRQENMELKATVFNHDTVNMDASVSLAPSEDFITVGDTKKTVLVKSNDISTVTFFITGLKVGTFSVKVLATAQRSSGFTVTETVTETLTVKPEGVERNRSVTIPILLTADQPALDRNVTILYANWTIDDVISGSRRTIVRITGDLMGHTVSGLQKLVQLPHGCGEQNMITVLPSVCVLAYLSAVGDLSAGIEAQAKENIRMGYTREMQQFRWPNGGFSAFGTRDTAPSTWLTAFVLRSFARARSYLPESVDKYSLSEAMDFLFSRQTVGTGNFYELGRVIHSEMQSDTGSTEALSVYVTISLLEAKKYGVEVNQSMLTSAISYVTSVAGGDKVKQRRFLAAVTAYALALNMQAEGAGNAVAQGNVEQLIGYVVAVGAPWRERDETSSTYSAQWYTSGQQFVTAEDVEVTAYCLLAYVSIGKGLDARVLAMWLVRQQNSDGGFRSTQDTVVAVQALAAYTELWCKSQMDTTRSVMVTCLLPALSPRAITIDSTNSAFVQIIDLPDDTSKINIRINGQAGSIVVVKVAWTFNTWPETAQRPPGLTKQVSSNSNKIVLSTLTSLKKPGTHLLQACVKVDWTNSYRGMVVTTISLPSGLVPSNLLQARNQSPELARLEEDSGKVHFYLDQPRDMCMTLEVQVTIPVENLQPGSALLYAYYDPDIRSEAEIGLMCGGTSCLCSGGKCAASTASLISAFSFLFLAAVFILLKST